MGQQLHQRLSTEQVRVVLENYQAKEISIENACQLLSVKRARFFRILAAYKKDPSAFTVVHRGGGNRKISTDTEAKILEELKKEKELIDDKDMPVRTYNYSAVRDSLQAQNVTVSVPTIIRRAKEHGFSLPKRERIAHDREVLTTLAGELVQHDSSHHLWSPFADRKWYLITTIDDYSRLLLYADLWERESTWAHLCALKSVFLRYGCPMKYYADQHAIFRYVKERDKFRPCTTYTKFTDDVDTQWRQVLKGCGVEPIYALSPQAKGKIERPYRWLQDRMVRTAAKEHVDSLEGVRGILQELVETYNTRWVHSTTKEIPILRFEQAVREGRSLFTPFTLKEAERMEDVFSIKMDRVVDAYRKVSLQGCEIRVPGGIPRDKVTLKMSPDTETGLVKIRIWKEDEFLGEVLETTERLPGVSF